MARAPKTEGSVSDQKLKELILYIAEESESDKAYGAVKLNKLLFYCDFLAFLNFGRSITEQQYFKLPKGPAPKRLLPVQKQMQSARELAIRKSDFYGFPQHRAIALREPNMKCFSGEDVELINKIIKTHWGKTATEISDESHGFIGWQLAKEKETIPYSVALVSVRSLSPKEIAIGSGLKAAASKASDNARSENH